MGMVKLYNDNVHPFSQEFKGKPITIGPKKCVEMEFEDAVQFRGMFYPMKRGKDNQPDPKYFKMLRIDEGNTPVAHEPATGFIHPMTGKRFATKAEYDAALEETKDEAITDEAAEREIAVAKRGPGRPKKHAATATDTEG